MHFNLSRQRAGGELVRRRSAFFARTDSTRRLASRRASRAGRRITRMEAFMASGKRKSATLAALQREPRSLPALIFGAYEFFFDALGGYYVAEFGDLHKAIAYVDYTKNGAKALEVARVIAANPPMLDAPGRFRAEGVEVWDLRNRGGYGQLPMPRFIYGMGIRLLGDEEESPCFPCPFDERLFYELKQRSMHADQQIKTRPQFRGITAASL
jgi:hypothetical protein